jgi:hypothetical protein
MTPVHAPTEEAATEAAAMREVGLRPVPFPILYAFNARIDRVNAGFAALTMNKDVGLSQAVFGIPGAIPAAAIRGADRRSFATGDAGRRSDPIGCSAVQAMMQCGTERRQGLTITAPRLGSRDMPAMIPSGCLAAVRAVAKRYSNKT